MEYGNDGTGYTIISTKNDLAISANNVALTSRNTIFVPDARKQWLQSTKALPSLQVACKKLVKGRDCYARMEINELDIEESEEEWTPGQFPIHSAPVRDGHNAVARY